MAIVGRLNQIQHREGLTQQEMAKAAGMHQAAMSRMLNGKMNMARMSLGRARKLTAAWPEMAGEFVAYILQSDMSAGQDKQV